jgi:hypothetical protein
MREWLTSLAIRLANASALAVPLAGLALAAVPGPVSADPVTLKWYMWSGSDA